MRYRTCFFLLLFIFIKQIIKLCVQYGETALIAAVDTDNLETAKMLIDKGANVNIKTMVC